LALAESPSSIIARVVLTAFFTLDLTLTLRASRFTVCRALFKADLWLAKRISS
jgi:hypothetical protein